jgi:hypothetical protein
MEDQEIVIRLDNDGFRVTIDPEEFPPRREYRICEIDHDEHDEALNLDVWEGIEFFQQMEHPQ